MFSTRQLQSNRRLDKSQAITPKDICKYFFLKIGDVYCINLNNILNIEHKSAINKDETYIVQLARPTDTGIDRIIVNKSRCPKGFADVDCFFKQIF